MQRFPGGEGRGEENPPPAGTLSGELAARLAAATPGGRRLQAYAAICLVVAGRVLWAITAYLRRRRAYRRILDEGAFPHLRVIELRNPVQAEALAASLRGAPES